MPIRLVKTARLPTCPSVVVLTRIVKYYLIHLQEKIPAGALREWHRVAEGLGLARFSRQQRREECAWSVLDTVLRVAVHTTILVFSLSDFAPAILSTVDVRDWLDNKTKKRLAVTFITQAE